MYKVNDTVILAMRAVCSLSERKLSNVESISSRFGCAYNTLTKAFKKLAKAGVLESKRGPAGGFRLARPLSSIHMAEVYRALCGELPESCQLHRRFAPKCPLCCHVRGTRQMMRRMPLVHLRRSLK